MTQPEAREADARLSTEPGPSVVADNPEAYIARDRRRALSAGMELPDRVSGSALFADISGFTPLTEALAKELGPQRGAEELTVNIGRVFQAVIGELDAFGGDVIYFSGDAITCWIDGDDGTLACAAAIAMQEAIGRTGNVVTPGGAEVMLAMKVAIAVGDARRFIVGDPESQLIDVLAGRLIDDLAAAEHFAQKGEVVLEPSAIRRLGNRVSLGELRHDEETDRTYAVLDQLHVDVPRTPVEEPPPLSEDLVRSWLLPPVFERLRTGRGEFLTELRPAIPVFLRFTGIDYDNDPDAIPQLDEFVRGAQKIMSGYGGNVLQLTLGDKGAYLYGVFGSPIAHEDDEARAAGAALELRDLEKSSAAREIQIGVTRGTLRSGTYGHVMRRTFVCLGDEVNLSARLMSAAPPGQIYVSQRIREGAGDGFIWEQLPDMKVKGKAQPVPVFSLSGSLERSSRRKTRFELRLVGRKAELDQLTTGLETALEHRGQIVAIAAEAGLGKSRLVAEFVRAARRRGIFVAFGECQAFGTNTGYFVWREIWRRLFRLEDGDSEAAQIAQVEAELAAIDPGYAARAPLLNDLLDLPIPDNDLTRNFDPKLRKASLEDLLTGCLRARAATEPIVVVLEDCHWIDELSRDLLQVLARASGDLRLLFLLAYRPAAEKGGGLGLERQQNLAEIELDHLDDAEAAEVVRSKLEQVLGQGETPSDELVELVTERAGGNPLYIEELVSFIASKQIDLHDRVAMADLHLPESLQTLILSRMDTIAEDARRSMKVASVIGRVFEAPMLPGAYPELGTLDAVLGHLETLRTADLVRLDRAADLAYLFKHAVTREVAYDSMPFSVRTNLHGRVGAYIEARDPDEIDRHLDLLAHHYWLSDDKTKKVEFLGRAAEAARDAFANTAAIGYYERLIPLLDGSERVAATLRLAKVLQTAGQLQTAEQVALEARGLAVDLGDSRQEAWAEASLAETAKRRNLYDDAWGRLVRAQELFVRLDEATGIADMLHLAGVIAEFRGEYDNARARYDQAREARMEIGDLAGAATSEGNLAIMAEFTGDYRSALEINDRALELRRSINDRRGIAIGEMNAGYFRRLVGELQDASAHLETALAVSREIGDPAMVGHAQATLAAIYRALGDNPAAAAQFAAALRWQRELDDRRAISLTLEDVAVLLGQAVDPALGFKLLGATEALRNALGAPRPPTLVVELVELMLGPREKLGNAAVDAAVAAGRKLSFDQALELTYPALEQLRTEA